jgi:hypothetical protein
MKEKTMGSKKPDNCNTTDISRSPDDLILPRTQVRILRDIAAHTCISGNVSSASRWKNGGVNLFFSGENKEAKYEASLLIANEVNLSLYRIDLSQLVDKYIGETEKELRKVFAAAEDGGAILLFDEADELFGKRSVPKDSHNRYGNLKKSYLLEKMKRSKGLVILAGTSEESLDPAFLRTMHEIVEFPFPDEKTRRDEANDRFPGKRAGTVQEKIQGESHGRPDDE